jgi:hypothetical protein
MECSDLWGNTRSQKPSDGKYLAKRNSLQQWKDLNPLQDVDVWHLHQIWWWECHSLMESFVWVHQPRRCSYPQPFHPASQQHIKSWIQHSKSTSLETRYLVYKCGCHFQAPTWNFSSPKALKQWQEWSCRHSTFTLIFRATLAKYCLLIL